MAISKIIGIENTTGQQSNYTMANVAMSGSYDDLSNKPTIPSVISHYGSGGTQSVTKIWSGVISPNTSNGYSIDISSAGFSNIISAVIVAEKNSASVYSIPNVSIKSRTTSAIVVNITEANSATTTILGITVLSGGPLVFANATGLSLHLLVISN